MYQVALCEDERIFAETQERLCRAIFAKLNIEYRLTVFTGSEDFLHVFTLGGKRYDLILLDIIMVGMNGMDLARMIRVKDKTAAIIFITSTMDYATQGYDVDALHYLNKPVDGEKLERLIARDYESRFKRDYFVFDSLGVKRKVAISEIICMETAGRRAEATLTDGTAVYYYGKLVDLLNKMPAGRFTRCHQAFAVNLDNIRELDGGDAVAVDGKRIPVSRAYVKAVEKAFMERFRDN